MSSAFRLLAFSIALALASPAAADSVTLERSLPPDGTPLDYLAGLDRLANGDLVLLDNGQNRLVRLGESAGTIRLDTGGGLFSSRRLQGMAAIGPNRFALAVGGVGKVALVDADGKTLFEFGDAGSPEGGVNDPADLTFSPNRRLYVADRGQHRIAVYGPDGVFLHNLTGSKDVPLRAPRMVDVDMQERVYVLGEGPGGAVAVLDAAGTPLRYFTGEQLSSKAGGKLRLTALAVVPETGLLYLGDSQGGRVYLYDWEQERILERFGTKGTQRGQFGNIAALMTLPANRVAVGDSENGKVEVYQVPVPARAPAEPLPLPSVNLAESHGAECRIAYRSDDGAGYWCFGKESYLQQGGAKAVTLANLENPVSAALGEERIAVIDNTRLKLYDRNGGLLYSSGENQKVSSGPLDIGADRFDSRTAGKFEKPVDVYLRHGKVYVADERNRRVQIHTRDGLYLDMITSPKAGDWRLDAPVAVAVDSRERIYVADRDQHKVFVFSADKRLLYTLDRGTGGGFDDLYDLEIDRDDQLYVLGATEANPTRIQVFRDREPVFAFATRATEPGAFDEPVSLSIARTGPTVVAVYDRDKQRLIQFEYRQVPKRVAGLQVAGGEAQVQLLWQPLGAGYVEGYRAYGAERVDGPFRPVGETREAALVLPAEKRLPYYRVAGVSDFVLEGPASDAVRDRFLDALESYRAGRHTEAGELLAELHEDDPRHPDTLRLLGRNQLALEQHEAALRSFEQLSALPGHEAEGLRLALSTLQQAGRWVEAKRMVTRLITGGHGDEDTFLRCAEINLAVNEPIGAVECAEKALAQNPDGARAHLLIGRGYIALDVVDTGREELAKARELAPTAAAIWRGSARIEQSLGNHGAAVEQFDRTLALAPDDLDSRLALARSLLALADYDRVRQLALELAGLEATAGEGQYLLGLTALKAERHGEALIQLTKATRTAPGHAAAWLALADTWLAMGKPEKMLEPLAHAAEADPDSFEAAERLGNHYFDAGALDKAVPHLRRAAALRSDDYAVQLRLGRALLAAGELQDAAAAAASAHRLDQQQAAPLVLSAEVAAKQGKYGAAISDLKQALAREENSFDLNLRLGGLYLESNLFDLARASLEKAALLDASSAAPHVMLGRLLLKRRLYDDAITSLDKAVGMEPTEANRLLLDRAYAEKKKSLDFKSNAPQIVLKDLNLEPVFSAAYKQYAEKPVGSIRVENTGDVDYGDLQLTFAIKGYMDFPATLELPSLPANGSEELPLHAAFNNRILEIDEDTGVQVEVALKYVRDGQEDAITLTQPMTIYGKNAILWARPQMVGAFVTPKDDTLRDFVRSAVNAYKPQGDALNDKVMTAMTLFSALSAHGIKYVTDPNAPYSKLAADQVDYVQFARETLKIKSGDCDDLSVLFSAALENLGVHTAIVDVPGHLLVMFDTGLAAADADRISADPELLAIHDGRVWIPLEVTMVETSFAEAWTEGARKYHQHTTAGELDVIALADAWQRFRPVTLSPADYALAIPVREAVIPRLEHAHGVLLERSLERLVLPYRAMLALNPADTGARMQIAITYARNGLHDKAFALFDELLSGEGGHSSAYNNRGNLYLTRGEYSRALKDYLEAERLDPADPRIKVNVAMAFYQGGDLENAQRKFAEATAAEPGVETQYAQFAKLLGR